MPLSAAELDLFVREQRRSAALVASTRGGAGHRRGPGQLLRAGQAWPVMLDEAKEACAVI